MGDEKMSKSLGNIVSLHDALSKYGPDALRLFVLGSHYRSPLSFSEDSLAAASRGAERLRNAGAIALKVSPGNGEEMDPSPYRERFIQAMDDDFNAPQAIAALFDFARDLNRSAEEGRSIGRSLQDFRLLTGVLGLKLEAPQRSGASDAGPFIDLLVAMRKELRQAKQYALADSLRERLQALGVTLEDTAEGTRWKHQPK